MLTHHSSEETLTVPPTDRADHNGPTMLDDDEKAPIDEHNSGASGDEYQPQDHDSQGESEMDNDDGDVEDVVPKVRNKAQGKKSTRGIRVRRADVEGVKATVAAAQTASSAKGVGKRKPEDEGTARTQVAVAPVPSALVLMNFILISAPTLL